MINELPLYLHPTEVILIDDDVSYSKNMQAMMLDKEIPIRIFNDPEKALAFLKKRSPIEFLDKLLQVENESIEKTTINMDFSTIHHELYNKDRFHQPSILILNYTMPGLSGKEFFEQIQTLPLKKILLTGEERSDTAVKMFNAGLIDRFFRKSEDNLLQQLIEVITDLKINFFQKISHSALLALEKKSPFFSFNDSDFIKFFLETIKQQKIVEYYALDPSGSYLLISSEGNITLLIIKTEEDMRILYELAEGEENVDQSLLDDLKNKKKLTFFLNSKDNLAPVHSWSLHDASCLVGENQSYYYALIHNSFFKPKSKIYTYSQFLEDNT